MEEPKIDDKIGRKSRKSSKVEESEVLNSSSSSSR